LEEVFGIVFDYTEFSFNYNLNSFKAEKLHVAIYLQFFINLKFFEPLESAARRGNQHAAAALSIIYAIAALQKNSMSARLASESRFWKNAVMFKHLQQTLRNQKEKLEILQSALKDQKEKLEVQTGKLKKMKGKFTRAQEKYESEQLLRMRMQNSLSWKMTLPIRVIGRALGMPKKIDERPGER